MPKLLYLLVIGLSGSLPAEASRLPTSAGASPALFEDTLGGSESTPLPPSYEYPRQAYGAILGAGAHGDCLWQDYNCGAVDLGLSALSRSSVYFAWQLQLTHSRTPGQEPARVSYAALGARVYPLAMESFDPYLGLTLGAEVAHGDASRKLTLGSDVSLGIGWWQTDTVKLGSFIALRQGARRHACGRGALGACERRSRSWWRPEDRWLSLGVELEWGFGGAL